MSKKNPCGLDFCPYKEIAGEYVSCIDCAWAEDNSNGERKDNEYDLAIEHLQHDIDFEPTFNPEDGSM